MLNKFRAFFLSLTIVSIMMFSVFGTTIVYADDGTTTESTETSTPATGAAEESVTSDAVDGTEQPEESVSLEETPQPEGEVVATEETPSSEEAVVTEEAAAIEATAQPEEQVAVTEEAVVTEATTEEVVVEASPESTLEQLPDNTTVTVINSEGEVQPLATQESADAIESAYDPIWCPEGQSPTPGANGCTESFSSFTELLTFLKANEGNVDYQQAGTIYIQKDQYLGGESSIDFNTYNFTSLNTYNLTLQGGWDTSDNSVDSTDTTQFNVPITIGSSVNPWIGSLTFNNISISGVYNQTGLTVYSEGDISLSNVEITNSQTGADLTADGQVRVDNSKFNNNKKSGANINSGTLAYITNSEFNNNGSGLKLNSSDGVTLNQVVANKNGQYGADITAVGIVDISDSIFSGNVAYTYYCKTKIATGGYGLKVVTTDAIYVQGINADDNYAFGASLNGLNVEVTAGSETFGGNTFNNNGYGLNIQAADYVVVSDTQANKNKLYGASITSSSDVEIENSFFDGNKSYTYSCKGNNYSGYGLQVVANDGIYLTNVSASENNLFGAHLDGDSVNIFGGFFNNNGNNSGKTLTGKGVEIISDTNVVIAEIEANNNQLFGANIQAVDDVTISDGFFNGNKAYTYSCKGKTSTGGGYGLQIVTNGYITITDIEASDNYTFGAQLTGGSVAISFGDFNNNGSGSLSNPTGAGLEIQSTGDVALFDIQANNNQLFGANIQAEQSVSITDGFFNGNVGYTYSCKGKTYQGYGLQVVSSEDVTLFNVTADENYLFGAHLEGTEVFVSYGSFSNNGTGNLSDHVGKGLEIVSTGNNDVSLYQVNASNNQLFGANIQAEGDVLIEASVFSGNLSYTSAWCQGKTLDGYGLQVVTTNDIGLFDVTANENGLYGAHLEGANVEIEDSFFNGNGSGSPDNPTGKGLEVVSTADVTLVSVEANNNQLFGANIQADGAVSVSDSVFSGNVYYTSGWCTGKKYDGYGLKVVTTNDITLDNVTANDNGLYGADLDGNRVDVSNSTFENNISSNGLTITADVAVLDNVTATNNGVDGAKVCANEVTVTNSDFEDNGRYGLNVGSPTFNESGNTYLNNGTAGLFANPTCLTNGGNNNNSNNSYNWWANWLKDHWKDYQAILNNYGKW